MPSIPVLFNAAIGGFVAGIQSGRLPIDDAHGEVEPVDFSTLVAAGVLFATELDATLQTLTLPTNVTSLASAGDTVVPSTNLLANAAESLPSALGAMVKAAWEGRSLPYETGGSPFVTTDYAIVARAVACLFVQYADNTDNDNNGAVTNPVLYNEAAAGFCAGWLTGRTAYVEANFDPIEPTDFAAVVVQAFLFAGEVDGLLNAYNNTTGLPANVLALTNSDTGHTIVPGTATVANAAESLPAAMVFICKAAWSQTGAGRSLPAVPLRLGVNPVANTCVSEFIEYCNNTDNS